MRKLVIAIYLLAWTSLIDANIASDILSSRTPDQQSQILSNIVNSAGEPCIPTQAFYQGIDLYGAAYWDVACADGRAFVIQISNNAAATTTIIRCSAMKSLGAECFRMFGR